MSWTSALARRGGLSDRFVRFAVRRALVARLRAVTRAARDSPEGRFERPPASEPGPLFWRPNDHPLWRRTPDLAGRILGSRHLEAAAHWPRWAKSLDEAEDDMLGLVAQRAMIEEGQKVLVIADRWAAPALFVAEMIDPARLVIWTPRDRPSGTLERQIRDADPRAIEIRGGRLETSLSTDRFDRILCLESLPRNLPPQPFLSALGRHLEPTGLLFVQLPCHRRYVYHPGRRDNDWLALEDQTIIPATDLLPRSVGDLRLERHWELSGEHYERTLRAWRVRLEENREPMLAALADSGDGEITFASWRLALLAREEMFGLRGGQEWWISHYLLSAAAT